MGPPRDAPPTGWNKWVRSSLAAPAPAPAAAPAAGQDARQPSVHVIFCVDNSGSMRNTDAASDDGSALSRAVAVSHCCRDLIAQQRSYETGQLYSLILFDDEAEIVFTRAATASAAARLQGTDWRPKRGTQFSIAWRAVERLVDASERDVPVHVVFLSDGRPGDLPVHLPSPGTEKTTVRVRKQEIPSAPAIVRKLAETRLELLTIHAVAIGDEDSAWLKRLISIAEGAGANASFMNPKEMNLRLSENSAAGTGQQSEPSAPAQQLMPPPPVASLGARPMLPPPAPRTMADAFSQIASSLTSSIATGGAKPRVERAESYEAKDAWETQPDDVTLWKGHKLKLNDGDEGQTWEPLESRVRLRKQPFDKGGQRNAFHLFFESNVDLPPAVLCPITGQLMIDPVVYDGLTYDRAAIEKLLPDARGAKLQPNLRLREECRRVIQELPRTSDHFVAKESRFKDDWNARLKSHKLSMRTAMEAQRLADEFNSCTPVHWPIISVLPASIYRLAPANTKAVNPSSYRYVSVEPYLEGEYHKFNGNNGYRGRVASELDKLYDGIAQTFTHWSYQHSLLESEKALMVCDIQGVGYQYTDATVCSEERRFGSTDHGESGFEAFFMTHRCNELCEKLNLTRVALGAAGGAGPSRNTATSMIEIIRTNHLNQRKRQRDIETREMQAAVKHGRKEPGNVPGSIRHVHNGVALVTDGDHRVGITAYPKK